MFSSCKDKIYYLIESLSHYMFNIYNTVFRLNGEFNLWNHLSFLVKNVELEYCAFFKVLFDVYPLVQLENFHWAVWIIIII